MHRTLELPLITAVRDVGRDRFSPSTYRVRVNTERGPASLQLTERAMRELGGRIEAALKSETAGVDKDSSDSNPEFRE